MSQSWPTPISQRPIRRTTRLGVALALVVVIALEATEGAYRLLQPVADGTAVFLAVAFLVFGTGLLLARVLRTPVR